MHRWKLINDALDLGKPEPEETYSTSEHLYAQLDIPREATGTLPRGMRDRAGLEAEAIEDIGETGKIRTPRRGRSSAGRDAERAGTGRAGTGRTGTGRTGTGRTGTGQPRKSARDAGEGAVQAGGQAASTRRRRRTRAGRDLGGEQPGQPLGAEPSAQKSAQKSAQRLGGRREAATQGENRPEETRRKAS